MNFIAVNEMNLNLIDWIEINDCCNGFSNVIITVLSQIKNIVTVSTLKPLVGNW